MKRLLATNTSLIKLCRLAFLLVSLLLLTWKQCFAADDDDIFRKLDALDASIQALRKRLCSASDGAGSHASCDSSHTDSLTLVPNVGDEIAFNPSVFDERQTPLARPAFGDQQFRTIAKRRDAWSKHMPFQVAVKLADRATAAFMPPDSPGVPAKYFLLGDLSGTLYVYSPAGDLLAEYTTEGASPITAIGQSRMRSNASLVVTGHADGCVRVHIMAELHRTRDKPLQQHAVESIEQNHNATYCPPADAPPDPSNSIKLLHTGRVVERSRTSVVLAVTERNDVVVLHGKTPYRIPGSSPILHLWYAHRQIRVLTESGISAASLHSNITTMKEYPCKDFNGTILTAGVSDAHLVQRAYGYTSEGELVHLALGGDKRITSCRLRSRRAFAAPGVPANMAMIKGHLLVAQPHMVSVLNITPSASNPLKSWIDEPIEALSRQLGLQGTQDSQRPPLLATNAQGGVVVAINGDIVGMYSRPVPKAPVSFDASIMTWSRPIMIICMICVAAWQFFRTRNPAAAGSQYGYPDRRFGGRGHYGAPGRLDPEIQRLLASYGQQST